MALALASVATIVNEPIYWPHTARMQKSHAWLVWTDQSNLNLLHSCIWYGISKLSIASRRIFPSLAPAYRKQEKYGWQGIRQNLAGMLTT